MPINDVDSTESLAYVIFMLSLTPIMRPNGVRQVHQAHLIRLSPDNEPFSTVLGPGGLPVVVAIRHLLKQRHNASSRQQKVAWVLASVLDLLAARGIDIDALVQTGDVLAPQQVDDIVDHLHFVGPRTAAIRAANARPGERPVIHVEPFEWTNRIEIAKKFIVAWLRRDLHLLRRDARTHAHLRAEIDAVEKQFKDSWFAVKVDPREGLEPEELRFFDEVIHPAHPLNVWDDDREMIFLICILYRLLGNRAREVLLFQLRDLVMREGGPALRLLPPDYRHDRSGTLVGLKRAPRYIRIPEWCADRIQHFIDVDRPKIGEALEEAGNLTALEAFRACPYMFVSARGTRLSSTTLYNRFRTLRDRYPDRLPADLSPSRLRNSRADEIVAAARAGGMDLSRVAESLFGWVVGSPMLRRYANMEAERQAGEFLRSHSGRFAGPAR